MLFSVPNVEAQSLLESAGELISNVCDGRMSLGDALPSDVISQLQLALKNWCAMMKPYRTANLWIMYMHMVSILRSLLQSSRGGNWKLYLQSLHDMLPFLAASGHNNYTKSLVLYLGKMEKLEETHPAVYCKFQEGLFVVRHSDSYWSGIFSDLCIEKVLMRSIKSVGGLTRGRGFQESTSLLWLLSMPACGEVHKALQEVTVLSQPDGDAVHKDISQSRLKRDAKDLQTVLDYLQERKPFTQNSKELHSLSSGIVGEGSVNVDSAKTIGDAILISMVGKSVSQHKFVKKDQVCTLASSVYVSCEGEKIEINPQQLYQRLIVAGIGNIQLTELFQYELCSYPSSLFDSKLLMRLPDKADLQNGLVKKIPACVVSDQPLDMLEVMYVVDGGAMLQRIPWPKSTSYFNLCKLYIQFIQRHYQRVLVVFDGYGCDPSTKDETHERRTGSEMGVDVDFTDDMILKMKKKLFLANFKNKQKFINSLSSQMEKEGSPLGMLTMTSQCLHVPSPKRNLW